MAIAALNRLIDQAESQVMHENWQREQEARMRARDRAGAPLKRIARRMGAQCCGIYMIRCDASGRVKIGKSTTVARRISQHAVTLAGPGGMVGPFRLVRFIGCSHDAVGAVEVMLHWLFREQRIRSLEIFDCSGDLRPESFVTAGDVYRAFAERTRKEIEA